MKFVTPAILASFATKVNEFVRAEFGKCELKGTAKTYTDQEIKKIDDKAVALGQRIDTLPVVEEAAEADIAAAIANLSASAE